MTVIAQWHFIFGLIFEITHVLKIRIFKVKPVSFYLTLKKQVVIEFPTVNT